MITSSSISIALTLQLIETLIKYTFVYYNFIRYQFDFQH